MEHRMPRLLRLRVRLHGDRLDHELAVGADPDATPELRRRADELTSAAGRRYLAAVLDRIRAEAEGPRRPFESAARLAREAICGCAAEIRTVLGHLEGPAAVSPRGPAAVSVLLHDTQGPLHRPDATEPELRRVLISIIGRLEAPPG
jgi:hypothetical protein